MRFLLFRIAAVLVSLAAVLLVIELLMHVLNLPRPVTNFTPVQGLFFESKIPGLQFQLLPHARSFHEFPDDPRGYFGERCGLEYVINSTGARDFEYTRTKPDGMFRIIFLGDSFTFGTGVRLEDTFVNQVERLLNPAGEEQKVQAINFGVPGYDTREEVLLLEYKCPKFSPDLVVMVMFLNDGHGGYSDEVFNVDVDEKDSLARWSRIYRAIRLAAKRSEAEQDLIDSWSSSFLDGSPSWTGIRKALKRAADLQAKQEFELAVVIFPVLYWLDEAYPFKEAHAKIAEYVESLGVPVLDLFPAFQGEDGPSLWVHSSNQHPNEQGHAIAGRAICEFLKEEGLLPE
ncbi:MAG: SGNH/GDSL hydrolase family protein [Planctomycetota bacterium]|jgi:lysophospholipase L1-like esterase